MLIIASSGTQLTEERTRKILLSGADIIRVSLLKRSPEKNVHLIKKIQDIIDDLNSSAKILLDLSFNRVILGDFDIKMLAVREGEEFICKSAAYSANCQEFIPIQVEKLGENVQLNQTLIVGDGEVALEVIEIINHDTIKVRMLNNGILQYMKPINIRSDQDIGEISEKYIGIINKVKDLEIRFISIPYIERSINEKIKDKLAKPLNKIRKVKKIIKIGSVASLKDIDSILADPFYDMVIFNRGLAGVNFPYERIGLMQKEIVKKAKRHKKSVIIFTDILESTMRNFIPSRADILDLTNMVIDGVDGILFGVETNGYARPAYTISVAKKIIETVENNKNF